MNNNKICVINNSNETPNQKSHTKSHRRMFWTFAPINCLISVFFSFFYYNREIISCYKIENYYSYCHNIVWPLSSLPSVAIAESELNNDRAYNFLLLLIRVMLQKPFQWEDTLHETKYS